MNQQLVDWDPPKVAPFLLKSSHHAVVNSELGEAASKEEHCAGRTLVEVEEACSGLHLQICAGK